MNTGQAIPISETEWQERLAALEQELTEIDRQDETSEEVTVATGNVTQLTRFSGIDARDWTTIT